MWVAAGRIEKVKLGRRVLIHEREIERLIAKHDPPAAGAKVMTTIADALARLRAYTRAAAVTSPDARPRGSERKSACSRPSSRSIARGVARAGARDARDGGAGWWWAVNTDFRISNESVSPPQAAATS